MQITLPTKQQMLKALELAVIGFVSTFFAVWAKQPDPFSKAAFIAAFGGAVGALYGIARGFLLAE